MLSNETVFIIVEHSIYSELNNIKNRMIIFVAEIAE
jgi:hypothetical protein